MKIHTFSTHLKNRKHMELHFWAVALLSVLAVFCIAVLSRAELRLSGELLAAGDGTDLAILSDMGSFTEVELVRETEDTKLYLLTGEGQSYLAHIKKVDGEWEVEKVEVAHN
jgi:hypothetical protein